MAQQRAERTRRLRESGYFSVEEFLKDMRAGKLRENFVLDEETFKELAEMVNRDKSFAGEVSDNGVLLLLASEDKFEIEGLIVMAEVCRGG